MSVRTLNLGLILNAIQCTKVTMLCHQVDVPTERRSINPNPRSRPGASEVTHPFMPGGQQRMRPTQLAAVPSRPQLESRGCEAHRGRRSRPELSHFFLGKQFYRSNIP